MNGATDLGFDTVSSVGPHSVVHDPISQDKVKSDTSAELDSSTIPLGKTSDVNNIDENENLDAHSEVNDKGTSDDADAVDEEVAPVDDVNEEDAWQDILGSGQLKKKVVVKGIAGDKPQRGALITADITGSIGSIEVERYENFSFQLGDLEVVQGLDLAIQLMERNETSDIIVSPKLAYDVLGDPPTIPSMATIEYNVTLKDFMMEPEHDSLTVQERMETGIKKRTRGNFWYKRKDYSQAAQCYRRALDYLDDLDSSNTKEHENEAVSQLFMERLKALNNMAAAQMNMKSYSAALKSVENVLMCEPDNVKALFRKAKIYGEQGELKKAISTLRSALTIEPDCKAFQMELSKLLLKQRAENEKEKHLYRKMFNITKTTESLKKPGNLLSWTAAIGGVAAIVAGIFLFRYRYQ